MISSKTTEDLIRIVSYGGGLDFNAAGKTQEDLVKIASFAAGNGARVIMRGIGHKTANDLIQIASFGKGTVIFAD